MDTRIALGLQPLQIPDQSAPLQKALTLQALMGQRDLQGLQLSDARRTADRNARYDALAGGAKSMEDFLAGYEKIDPAAASKLRADQAKARLDALKGQGELDDQQGKAMASLAGSITSLPPDQQAVAYPAMAAEWKRLRLPNADKVPDQWSPEMLPHLEAIAARGLNSEQAASRADFAKTVPPKRPAPTPTTPVDLDHEGNVIQMQNEMAAAGMPPSEAQMPTVEVEGNANWTAEDWQKEGFRLRSLGTKIAAEQAKEAFAMAKNIEDADFKKRDQWESVAGAPGVTRNKLTNEFSMNGKPLPAEKVQEIAAKQRKAGASSVNVGTMTPEAAAKTELLNQGISDMVEFKAMVMPNGKVDRSMIAGLNAPGFAGVPGTDSRTAWSLIYNAVEAKLRAESGAAVQQSEVERIAARFIPSILDSDATVQSKLERMDAFLRGSYGRIKNAGTSTEDAKAKAPAAPQRRATDKIGTEFTPEEIEMEMKRRGLK